MGDPEQSLPYDQRDLEAEARLETGQDGDALVLSSAGYESPPSQASVYQDLGDGKLGFKDQEEETLPEEVAGDEFLDAQDPGEAVPELERVLRRDEEDKALETRCVGVGGGAAAPRTPPALWPGALAEGRVPLGPMCHPRVRESGRAGSTLAGAHGKVCKRPHPGHEWGMAGNPAKGPV